ncbi:alpha/beta fold hydrolase [Altererythrobacter lutimaris]|uniref:Alpha/beta hydrolase n=1 Tax=Altererythrobacter lutimaris TaxID=2743979 RepID=A0A850H2Y5_9SPHN|nr:alpha/beta hydrolase [Altererythrobacter lutimaris]
MVSIDKAPIAKAYVRIAEGQLHLRHLEGAPEVTPLILSHASPSSSRSLEPLLEALGQGRALYAFDNPCNGQSCAPVADAPAMADFADMLARGSAALGQEKVALYGTHTGSHIMVEWALAEPDRVDALILDGVALMDEATAAEFLEKYAPHKVPDETGGQFHWAWNFIRDQMFFYPHYKKDNAHRRPEGVFDACTLHDLTMDVLGNLETYHLPYEAVFRHDVRARLKLLDLPVLILSHDDGALDEASKEVAALVAGSQIVRTDGSPEAKAAAINTFLETHT